MGKWTIGFEKPEDLRCEGDVDFNIVCADTSAYKLFGNSIVVPVFTVVAELLAPFIIQEKNPNPKERTEDKSAIQLLFLIQLAAYILPILTKY